MKGNSEHITDIYLRRISLFQDLLNCVIRERDNLINQDIKGIWDSLAEKQTVLDSLEETRHQFNEIKENDLIRHDIPQEDRDKIMELSRTLARLRQEIRARVAENVAFINETLDFFHELISAMAISEDDSCKSYGPYGGSHRGHRSLIYQGEV